MSGTNSEDGNGLGRIPEQVKQQAAIVTREAANIGRAVGEAVVPKAEEIADRSKAAGADAVAGVARTAHALADSVAQDSPAIAEYVRGAGQKIDRLANDLREKKVGDLLTSAAEFGRSQPVILLAGAAIVGFALSRLIKAGVATPAQSAPGADGDYGKSAGSKSAGSGDYGQSSSGYGRFAGGSDFSKSGV